VKRKSNNTLDLGRVMKDFQEAEVSSSRHKGSFEIDKPSGEALDAVLRAKPERGGSRRATARRR
jgi:hypothetical protein